MHHRKQDAVALIMQEHKSTLTAAPKQRSEHEFAQDAEKISAKIDDVKKNWTERVDALRELQSILVGGAGSLRNFKEVINDKIRYGLTIQVGDLRSQVVKEACLCIMAMCKLTPPAVWEDMVAWFVPALIKQLPVTVLAISLIANEVTRFLIENNRMSMPAVRHIIEGTKFKNVKTRVRSFENLFFLVHSMPLTHMHHTELDMLCHCVITGLSDTDPTVRQFSRLLYWALEKTTAKATEVWARLGDQKRKQVSDEKKTFMTLDRSVLQPKQNMYAREWDGVGVVETKQQLQAEASSSTVKTVRTRSTTPSRGVVRSRSRSASAAKPSRGNALSDSRAVNQGTPTMSKKPRMSTTAPTPPHIRQEEQQALSHVNTLPSPSPQRPLTLDDLLLGTNHHDWETRADCYGKIASMTAAPEAQCAAARVLEHCTLKLHNDAHFKVGLEILSCMQKVVEAHPKEVLPSIEKILVAVFGCMSDKKSIVKDKARTVIDSIMAANTVGTMYQALLKVLDYNSAKVRVSCLECFLYILKFCEDYLSNGKNTKQGIMKLLRVLTLPAEGDAKEIEKMAISCLHTMSKTQPTTFVNEAVGLQMQQKKDLLTYVGKAIPNLREVMQLHSQSRNSATPHIQAAYKDPMAGAMDVSLVSTPATPPSVQVQNPPRRTLSEHKEPPNTQTEDGLRMWGQGDSSDIKQRALRQLLQFKSRQGQWKAHYGEFMKPVLATLKDSDYVTRSLAVTVVQMVVENMPFETTRVLGDVLKGLFDAVDDQQSEVSSRAREALYSVVKLPADAVLVELLRFFGKVSDRVTQIILVAMLPKTLPNASPDVSQECYQTLEPLIFTTIQAESTDLRKAATWCLVDIYLTCKPLALALCKRLPPAKVRLLDFYISKRGTPSDLASELAAVM
eukprot:TRINITY_DN7194_c0_g3_i2.p1 TRINITY_DN7194_c0_g3~~TRINITY_DN7194_c0_g3_i2.p1  ORF type:complete len:901 (+),score=205.94 TRINITY_DN7194_c0_g3_i2:63-2765(+)